MKLYSVVLFVALLLSCREIRLTDSNIHTFDRGILQISPGVYIKGVSLRLDGDVPLAEIYFFS